MIRCLLLAGMILLLSACGFFDKDNTPTPTPLTSYHAEIKPRQLWSTKAGSGAGDEYLKMSPTLDGDAIFTASANGVVSAINKHTGAHFWTVSTKVPATSGPGV